LAQRSLLETPEAPTNPVSIGRAVEAIYRRDSRRVFATLIRLLGDFDRAEEALHEAFRAAVEQWPQSGVPENPVAWLISAGRFRAIDQIRRDARFESVNASEESERRFENVADESRAWHEDTAIEDDRLRLIFTCCHPALAEDAQIALTLREVCGLTTEAIARAYLSSAPTIAQRIVRAKAKIRDAKIPYEVPEGDALRERLRSVLRVVYLVYNEGYLATSGGNSQSNELVSESIYLGRLLVELNGFPDAKGLLALMLLQESRRSTRFDSNGELCLLDAQDRTRWDRAMIEEGIALVRSALVSRGFGAYTLQAAIAAVHAEALRYEDTDWRQIVALYDVLMRIEPSPVVALNRAVAVAMHDGIEAGLSLVDALLEDNALDNYHLAHATRADFCRRLGRVALARSAYERALALTQQESERRFLSRRLAELGA
jgi:RNA polymerase sigma-70 factor (ECF subfamily)